MKNPHGVEPTRYMKKNGSNSAIACNPNFGPLFGNDSPDICIVDNCYDENSCVINESSCLQYDCHSDYRSSLYVNSGGPDNTNWFTVLDYEVYSIGYESKEYVYNTCKYPDIIWKYIETKDISEESLRMIDNEDEIRNDLNLIQCRDVSIRLKISRYYLKNPSEYLVDTQIIDKRYDGYLREWIGDYDMKLLYRASEHGYSAESFHEYCDAKGPTLVIIKSEGGWIFGGYTTQSWSGKSIYNDMIFINNE